MERIKEMPVVGQIMAVLDTYPRLSAWVVLSAGIIALLVYEARDVGLSTGNWIALIVASIIVAGLCIWIVGEDDDEQTAATYQVKSTTATQDSSLTDDDKKQSDEDERSSADSDEGSDNTAADASADGGSDSD